MTAKSKEKTYEIVTFCLCVITAVICVYPLLYTLLCSFCQPGDINVRFFIPIPSKFTVAPYVKVFNVGGYLFTAILVSVFRTVVGTVLSVGFSALLAYGVSRKELPGRKGFVNLLLFCILFNGGLIPTFLVIKSVGLLNNIWVYVIPSIINVWNVIVIKQFFENLPGEVEESAKIDGANEWNIFSRVILPMSKPVLAAIALFTMVGQWNSWFDALIYVTPRHHELWPLQYYATITFNNLNQANQGDLDDIQNIINLGVDDMSVKMALTVVTCLPILVVYPFFQKYFTKGVYVGVVKG